MIVSDIKVYGLEEAIKYASLPFSKLNAYRRTTLTTLAKQKQRSHAKFLRQVMIGAYVQAPMFWWVEFDTYKVGTVRNSSSTMHTLLKNKIDSVCFDTSLLTDMKPAVDQILKSIMNDMNRMISLERDNQELLLAIKSLLPSSFVYHSYVTFNYEVLRTMYFDRRYHKLPHWRLFLDSFKNIPYFDEFIQGE